MGERVYAVGDIHGRLDLLLDIERLIDQDLVDHQPRGQVTVVYLGDYVDRGPDSRRVLDTLAQLSPAPLQRRFLLGNHDYWFHRFLTGAGLSQAWMRFGGETTLKSYGVVDTLAGSDPAHHNPVRQRLLRRVPPGHLRFLGNLLPSLQIGGYLFVHAGIRPGVPLETQDPNDLMMIREPFLSSKDDHGAVVVHGHTVVEEPEVCANRIGVDTGACWTGRLTAAVLEADDVRFLSTREPQ